MVDNPIILCIYIYIDITIEHSKILRVLLWSHIGALRIQGLCWVPPPKRWGISWDPVEVHIPDAPWTFWPKFR